MADSIISIPFKIVAVDTAEHELAIDPSLIGDAPITLLLEVTTGTIKFSIGRASSSQSATYSQATNNKCPLTLSKGKNNFFYTATTIGDTFVGSV